MERYDEGVLARMPRELRDMAELPWPVPERAGAGREEEGFPLEELPGVVREYVSALAETTQTSPRLAGLLCLGVLATAAQSRYTVEVTPDWHEPLCLYTLAVAEPGERKSAVLSALLDPVREYEREIRETEAADVAWSAGMKAALEKCLQNEQRGVASCAPDTPEFERASKKLRRAAEEAAGFRVKAPFRLLVDDTTPEKLVDIMDAQGGSVTLASAEGGLFACIASGRYESAGSLDVYLKAHAGDEILVDRIGRGINLVKDPRLTVMLTAQPSVLREVTDNSEFRGRGLTARFLYTRCPSMLGKRRADPEPIPPEVKESYRSLIRHLLSSPWSGAMTLDPEAQAVRLEMQRRVEELLAGRWANMRDWGGKLMGAMVRIAGLIHMCSVKGDPTGVPISCAAMESAASLAIFLSLEAEAVFDVCGVSALDRDAMYIADVLERGNLIYTLRRELYRSCSYRFDSPRAFDRALGCLGNMGFIREATVHGTGTRGVRYVVVNPRLIPSSGIRLVDTH